MARRRKRGRAESVVDGAFASLGVGGPATSKKRRRMASIVPHVSVPSGPTSSLPAPTPPCQQRSTKQNSKPVSADPPKLISWKDYFLQAGLLTATGVVDPFTAFNGPARKSLRQNFSRLASSNSLSSLSPSSNSVQSSNSAPSSGLTPASGSLPPSRFLIPQYIATSFNFQRQMRDEKRAQPPEAEINNFEATNEPTLAAVGDASCVILDNSGTDSKEAEPIAIKIGAMPMVGANRQFTPAIPTALTSALLYSTLVYISACHEGSIADDKSRHGHSTMHPRQGGPDPPPNTKGKCHHIHVHHCARNDNELSNIQLYRGPAGTWDSRTANQPLQISTRHPSTNSNP